MSTDPLGDRMRSFERGSDPVALPDTWLLVRLDGRGFTRLTKELHDFDKPFDLRFRALMIETAGALMQDSGVGAQMALTHSDEVTLILPPESQVFGRRLGKLGSVLAGAASATFSLALGQPGTFEARVSQLPTLEHVLDYIAWRQSDAHRNALSGHCYWALRRDGQTARQATSALEGASVADKNELLFQRGINVDQLPSWQKRGVALVWSQIVVEGTDPRTGATVETTRRRLTTKLELPYGAQMREWAVTHLRPDSADAR
jgi:tRNA(His) 5'-end guanylyltransferase